MASDESELTQPAPEGTDAVAVLTHGEVEVLGRMPWSSNATYLVTVHHDGIEARAIYKPHRGERPLWDFPSGLYKREVAAYELSEAMGFHVVPPTVLCDGPFGIGSLQWFVGADFREHYFSLQETRPELHDWFRTMAVFDYVANNTDRKSGHCLIDAQDRIWGIDNGLCFSVDFKLRTVIWEFGGEPLTDQHKLALASLVECVPNRIADLLDADEVAAISERASELMSGGVLPIDHTGRRYPWPLV
jgi:uncharacterized repeat protein (TIGR03843 family)